MFESISFSNENKFSSYFFFIKNTFSFRKKSLNKIIGQKKKVF